MDTSTSLNIQGGTDICRRKSLERWKLGFQQCVSGSCLLALARVCVRGHVDAPCGCLNEILRLLVHMIRLNHISLMLQTCDDRETKEVHTHDCCSRDESHSLATDATGTSGLEAVYRLKDPSSSGLGQTSPKVWAYWQRRGQKLNRVWTFSSSPLCLSLRLFTATQERACVIRKKSWRRAQTLLRLNWLGATLICLKYP